MSFQGLTQRKIHWFNFNLSQPLKCQIVWTPNRCGHNVGPDLGPNYLKGLSADDNVMLRFTKSENTSVQLQIVITSKVLNSLDPDHVQT